MTGRGFEINKQGIARMMRDMQKEFDRHPIRVPVKADIPELPDTSHGATVTYNGPVIYGSANGAQLAWNNGAVSQSQAGARIPSWAGIAGPRSWPVAARYGNKAIIPAKCDGLRKNDGMPERGARPAQFWLGQCCEQEDVDGPPDHRYHRGT